MDRIAVALGCDARRDGAEQDRKESTAFDQRITGRQLFAGEKVRQDAVFHRAKKRTQDAKQKQRDEEEAKRMECEARDGERGNAYLDEFDTLRDPGLVVAVGKFATEAGEEKVRGDEGGAGELNECRGIGVGQLKHNQKSKRRLEEVVAERGEELAQEQRREAARRHQGREHGPPAVCLPPGPRRPRRFSLDGRGRVGDAIAHRSRLCNNVKCLPQN